MVINHYGTTFGSRTPQKKETCVVYHGLYLVTLDYIAELEAMGYQNLGFKRPFSTTKVEYLTVSPRTKTYWID